MFTITFDLLISITRSYRIWPSKAKLQKAFIQKNPFFNL